MSPEAEWLRVGATECAVVHGSLDSARTGSSSALVVRSDAGIGKTALLDDRAGDRVDPRERVRDES
jgi:hypothetical protein